jgi:arylsulfatase A-like enzyme/lysophospholipase L1-like esterase
VITLTSLSAPGALVRHDVVLPNWSNPILSRIELKNGAVLETRNPYPEKQMVVMGDSISHGTGQGASYKTYPYIAADMMDMELFNMAVGGGKIAPEVADLLQYFDPVEAIWVLAGYNDWQGSSESINSISNDYETLLTTIRTHQPDAELFCCTLTYTINTVDAESGVTVTEVRQAVSDVVNARILAGDTNLYLIAGEAYSDASFLNDAVHFSEAGAAMFATNVFSIMDPVVNPPIVPQTSQTNIVMIVIDDLGWMDLSIQGSEFYETPRIDQLASNGMRFTQGYAAHPRCLPSRYGLMTGHFPGANGVPGGPENCLRPWETTVAEAFKANGYATCFAGKWHLIGTHGVDNLPQNQGFDVNFSGGKAGAPPTYFYPYRAAGTPAPTDELAKDALYFENEGVEGEYVTDRLTDEALAWMDQNADQPMFLCMWHYGVHTPYEAPADLVAKYEAKLATMDYGGLPEYVPSGIGEQKMRQDHPTYAAMVESVDTNIGRLMDKVAELGISSNTIFIFTSDNGGLSNRGGYNTRELATANYPLRTGKGWLYEGGIREAFIVSGPGVVPMVNSNAVVTGTDIFPTSLELAGLPLEPTNHTDGVSFAAALRGESYDRGEPIFWHSPSARPYSTGDFNSSAVRDGDYKLIWFYDTPGQPYELYNVKTDIGENFNLAESRPDKAAELLAMVQAWQGGANTGTGVIFKQDADDVAKPPQPYLYNPGAPLGLTVSAGNVELAWNDWLGYDYKLWSKTNLLDAAWVLEGSGLTVTNLTLPANGPTGFYQLELLLQPEN